MIDIKFYALREDQYGVFFTVYVVSNKHIDAVKKALLPYARKPDIDSLKAGYSCIISLDPSQFWKMYEPKAEKGNVLIPSAIELLKRAAEECGAELVI